MKVLKNEEGKIKGINKFIYRGYEVYETEKESSDMSDNSTSVSNTVVQEEVKDNAGQKKVNLGSRIIIDDLVRANRTRNKGLYDSANAMPIYSQHVNRKPYKVSVRDGVKDTPILLIGKIVQLYQYIRIQDEYGGIAFKDSGTGFVRVHTELIKFVKACVIAQYSESAVFSAVVTSYVNELLIMLESNSLSLPIALNYDIKLQEVIVNELNEFLIEICNKYNIPYGEVIKEDTGNKKRKIKKKDDTEIEVIDAPEVIGNPEPITSNNPLMDAVDASYREL